jgi:hypothetical protein
MLNIKTELSQSERVFRCGQEGATAAESFSQVAIWGQQLSRPLCTLEHHASLRIPDHKESK